MDVVSLVKPVIEVGLMPILILIFIKFFFERDKTREAQLNDLYTQFEKREGLLHEESNKREEQYKEREKILVAESARREELLKREADKREKIIREEAEKRESALLISIDNYSRTMREISDTLTEIKSVSNQAQYKIDSIESKLEKLCQEG